MCKENKMIQLDTKFILDYMMPNVDGQWQLYEQLNEFEMTFEPSDDTAMWYKLIQEEAVEWLEEYVCEGVTPNLLKEYCDILYVLEGFSRLHDSNLADVPEGVTEDQNTILLRILWTAANISLTTWTTDVILEGFDRVHKSNMSKLTEEGKVLRREDGKVLKSDQYMPPELADLIDDESIIDEVKKKLGL